MLDESELESTLREIVGEEEERKKRDSQKHEEEEEEAAERGSATKVEEDMQELWEWANS